ERSLGGQARARAGERRCDEEQHLVDERGLEERRGESRTAFEEERLDVLLGESAKLVLERAREELELRVVRQRAASEREAPRLADDVDVAGVEPRIVGANGSH